MYFQNRTKAVLVLFLFHVTTARAWHKSIKSVAWIMYDTPDQTEEAQDMVACIRSCMKSSACHAVDYNEMSKLCRRFHSELFLDINESGSTSHIAFVRQIYGIHVYRSSEQGGLYTYEEAQTICSSQLGGRMMTEADLQTAHDAGGNKCSCGWLEGRKKRYPMQVNSVYCGSYIGIVSCESWSTAAAWCLVDVN